jgi:hypothetical protein
MFPLISFLDCGNALGSGATAAPDTDCSMTCSGNSTELCGGSNRISVYGNGGTPLPGPFTNPGPHGWASVGCFSDNAAARTLTTEVQVTGGGVAMTVGLCTSACTGYALAGLEYGGECYCGNTLQGGGSATGDGCTMLCNGVSSTTEDQPTAVLKLLFRIPPSTAVEATEWIFTASAVQLQLLLYQARLYPPQAQLQVHQSPPRSQQTGLIKVVTSTT